jgi:hypothetical protein
MGQGLRVDVIACAFEVLDLCAMRAVKQSMKLHRAATAAAEPSAGSLR